MTDFCASVYIWRDDVVGMLEDNLEQAGYVFGRVLVDLDDDRGEIDELVESLASTATGPMVATIFQIIADRLADELGVSDA